MTKVTVMDTFDHPAGDVWAAVSDFGGIDKYLRGFVQAPETTVYVSRGLGVSAIPARIGSRPEINVITLVG